jgi:drug/metabolite transporter (DMT)-like permease
MRARLFVAIAVTLLTWSSAYAAIRHAVHGFPPGALALIRFATASAVLAGYAAAARRDFPRRVERRDLIRFALLGVIGVAIYHVALNAGERTVGAGAASLLVNTAPLWTALLGSFFLGERLGARGWAGLLLAFSGAAMVSIGSAGGLRLEGDVGFVLVAALATAIYFVMQKPLLRRYGAIESTCLVIWLGTVPLLVFAPECLRAIRTASPSEIGAALYLGIAPGAIGYITWTYLLARMPASRAASLLYLVPPLAFLIGWITLGEAPGWPILAGGIPILAGVALVNARSPAAEPRAEGSIASRPEAAPDR